MWPRPPTRTQALVHPPPPPACLLAESSATREQLAACNEALAVGLKRLEEVSHELEASVRGMEELRGDRQAAVARCAGAVGDG